MHNHKHFRILNSCGETVQSIGFCLKLLSEAKLRVTKLLAWSMIIQLHYFRNALGSAFSKLIRIFPFLAMINDSGHILRLSRNVLYGFRAWRKLFCEIDRAKQFFLFSANVSITDSAKLVFLVCCMFSEVTSATAAWLMPKATRNFTQNIFFFNNSC